MEKVEKFVIKGVFSLVLLFLTNIVLYFFNFSIPINIITILFTFIFSYVAVIILLIISFFL